jgi:hypothetical protein
MEQNEKRAEEIKTPPEPRKAKEDIVVTSTNTPIENKTPPESLKVLEVIEVPLTNTDLPNNSRIENKTPEINTMEVHHHPELHHKPKPWKEYILEFIMIVLAVTTGFFADNLRENMADREKEKQAITSLVSCLASDTVQLNSVIKSNQLIVISLDSLSTLKNADLTIEENKRKFYEYSMNGFSQDIFFRTNDAAMQQLKSAGMMRLIKEQKIIDSILGYESVNKATVGQEADYYFVFKESLLDYKKVVTFSVVRDTAFSSYIVSYGFIKIHIKKTEGLIISHDLEKVNAVFNNAPIMSIVLDAYCVFMHEQLLYAKRLITLLKKEYKLKGE